MNNGTPSTRLSPAPQGGTPPQARQPWHGRLQLWAVNFLPLLLMAFLAFGTWWLVKNSLPTGSERPAVPPRHEPDYEMRDFSVRRYNADGSLRAQLEGELLRHYPDTDTLEVDQVRVRTLTAPDGRVTTATGQRAVANGEGTEVELFGSAQVVREAAPHAEAVYFRSDYLHAFLDEDRVMSNHPVTVTRGNTEVRADGMAYTHTDGVVRFNGRARATFGPKGGKP